MNTTQSEHAQTEAMYAAAMEFAAEKASISYVQRKCRCSYNDAERMLERMVSEGIIETYGGRKTVATTPSQPAAPQGGAEVNWWEADVDKYDASISPMQPAQGVAYAELPAECDSPELCAVSRSCAGQYGTQRICASNGQAPATQQTLERNAVPAEWLEQAYREGWAACRDAETIGGESEDWSFGNSTANSRMIDAQQAVHQPAPTAQAAPAAGAVAGPRSAVELARDLKNAIDTAMELRQQLRLMEEHARGEVWRWQADGANDLATMGNRMGVLIYASDLRNLLAAAPTPAAQADSQPEPPTEYPALPEPSATGLGDEYEAYDRTGRAMGKAYETILYFKADQMRAYVDADRQARKQGGGT